MDKVSLAWLIDATIESAAVITVALKSALEAIELGDDRDALSSLAMAQKHVGPLSSLIDATLIVGLKHSAASDHKPADTKSHCPVSKGLQCRQTP